MKGRNAKKFLAALLTGVLGMTALTGCGDTADDGKKTSDAEKNVQTEDKADEAAMVTDSGLDISEEVELVMYIVSDRPAGQDVVDENLNKILKEKLNCTLKINWLGWAEYGTKYPNLFTSGEEFDMAYAAGWLDFQTMAQKGAFMSLDDLWEKYAPKNFAKQSEAAKEAATINGHYYCVPTLNVSIENYGPTYRTDLLDETEWDGVMETFEDMEEYLEAVKKKYPEMEPLNVTSEGMPVDNLYINYMGYSGIAVDGLVYDLTAENPKVELLSETEWVKDYLEMINRWNEKGLFSKTALADTDTTKPQSGKSALTIHNNGTYQNMVLTTDFEWAFSNYVSEPRHLGATQDVMVLSNTCKNPERALAFWDLLTSDQEVYDAFFYGVEGVTYELNEDGQYTILDTDLYATNGMWAGWVPELDRAAAGSPTDMLEMREAWEAEIVSGEGAERFVGFSFDSSTVETEIAMCTDVYNQYWGPLSAGYTDMETGLEEYAEQMKIAGIEKIRDEAQRQLDEFLAALGE